MKQETEMTRYRTYQHFFSDLCDIAGWLAVKTHEQQIKQLPVTKWDDFAERLSYGGMFSTIINDFLAECDSTY